jgi:hypothetical protein
VLLVNGELVEMMRVAQIPQTASLDNRAVLHHAVCAVIASEKPRRSPVGKCCASLSDRSSSALDRETPAIEQLRSPGTSQTGRGWFARRRIIGHRQFGFVPRGRQGFSQTNASPRSCSGFAMRISVTLPRYSARIEWNASTALCALSK